MKSADCKSISPPLGVNATSILLPLFAGYGISPKFWLPLLPKSQISAQIFALFWVTQHSTVNEVVLVRIPPGKDT